MRMGLGIFVLFLLGSCAPSSDLDPVTGQGFPETPGTSFTGHETGNGGGVLVCTDPQTGKETTTFFDIWEGRQLGLDIEENNKGHWDQLTRIYNNFSKSHSVGHAVGSLFSTVILGSIYSGRAFADLEVPVPVPNYMAPHILAHRGLQIPANCVARGLGIFWDYLPALEVQEDLYEALTKTGQVAFALHEQVYYGIRKSFGFSHARSVRGIVGCGLASKPCPEVNPYYELPGDSGYYCTSRKGSHVLFVDEVDYEKWKFTAIKVGGNHPPTRSYFHVHGHLEYDKTNERMMAPKGLKPRAYVTRSSENDRFDIAFPFRFAVSPDQGGEVLLNRTDLHCRPRVTSDLVYGKLDALNSLLFEIGRTMPLGMYSEAGPRDN